MTFQEAITDLKKGYALKPKHDLLTMSLVEQILKWEDGTEVVINLAVLEDSYETILPKDGIHVGSEVITEHNDPQLNDIRSIVTCVFLEDGELHYELMNVPGWVFNKNELKAVKA